MSESLEQQQHSVLHSDDRYESRYRRNKTVKSTCTTEQVRSDVGEHASLAAYSTQSHTAINNKQLAITG